jgi:hypothetical protein
MGYAFSITKRVFANNGLIAFIDLLGTRKLYENTVTERQAKKILYALLSRFHIKFDEDKHFGGIEQNFDVSIFADSIVISERKTTPRIVERLVDFLQSYQADLYLNLGSLSRAVVIKDSFFSFKITDASPESILGSPYTSVSLCGGKSIKLVHDYLEGLPMGVYVAKTLKKDLSEEQKGRVVAVRNDDNLLFIKQRYDIRNFLLDKHEKTFLLLTRNPNADNKAIRDSLKACHPDEDCLKKFLPWVLVHLGRQNEIIKCNKALKRGAAKNPCSL